MTITAQVQGALQADLLEQIRAGNEVMLFAGEKPFAKIIPAAENDVAEPESEIITAGCLKFRTFKGGQVLTPNITHAEIAEEMYGE